MGELILIRHGETAWSRSGRHTGRTDVPLTDAGVATATALAPVLAGHRLVAAFSSPLARAVHTARLAGLSNVKTDSDLQEWDYGGYEGLTTPQIHQVRPDWDLWRDGVTPGDPGHPGERLQDVAARCDAVLDRVRPLLADGQVVLVAHGHLLRVLTARWLGLAAEDGRLFGHPGPGTLSTLGTEHGRPVLVAWSAR